MAGEIVALGLGILAFIFSIIAIFILAFIFWIFMIVDCAKRKFKNDSDKIVWILILVFLGIIGAIVYYFVVKREDKK